MTTPSLAAAPDHVPPPLKSPAEVGFAADVGDKLDAGVRSGLLRGVHTVVVLRQGRLALERYYEGTDESWGRPLGRVQFKRDTLHDLRSVTKSVVSLLYGIALEKGLVPPLDAPLLAQFPQYADLAADPARTGLKIEHALNMTLGTEWNEQIPYSDPNNSEIRMERAPDRYRFVLDRPIVSAPGTKWNYNGGCPALLGHIIAQGTKQPLDVFAREVLFKPLGITSLEWAKGGDGVLSAASGLRLTTVDTALIGQLVLNKGVNAQGIQIVPKAWIEACLTPATATPDGLGYGRQWWHGEAPVNGMAPQKWLAGFGNGGQRLWIMPSTGIVCAITAGNYNAFNNWVFPARIWTEIVLANVTR